MRSRTSSGRRSLRRSFLHRSASICSVSLERKTSCNASPSRQQALCSSYFARLLPLKVAKRHGVASVTLSGAGPSVLLILEKDASIQAVEVQVRAAAGSVETVLTSISQGAQEGREKCGGGGEGGGGGGGRGVGGGGGEGGWGGGGGRGWGGGEGGRVGVGGGGGGGGGVGSGGVGCEVSGGVGGLVVLGCRCALWGWIVVGGWWGGGGVGGGGGGEWRVLVVGGGDGASAWFGWSCCWGGVGRWVVWGGRRGWRMGLGGPGGLLIWVFGVSCCGGVSLRGYAWVRGGGCWVGGVVWGVVVGGVWGWGVGWSGGGRGRCRWGGGGGGVWLWSGPCRCGLRRWFAWVARGAARVSRCV